MLDQNTTTVLTTLITVLGTLSGVVLGAVLSNRYVARQEKAKRNTAVIEEVYTLMNGIVQNINNAITKKDSEKDMYLEERDHVLRVRTLLMLYLLALKLQTNDYVFSLKVLLDSYDDYRWLLKVDPNNKVTINKEFSKIEELKRKHIEIQLKLQQTLEKLIR